MQRTSAKSAIAALAALLTVVATGCQSPSEQSDPGNPRQVEVITWWGTGPDENALLELVRVFEHDNADLQFIDATIRGADGARARQAIDARLDAGNPPDSFLTRVGSALAGYVEAGRLQPLTESSADPAFVASFDPDVLSLAQVDGQLYAIPCDVHRANVLWASVALLSDAGLDPTDSPASIDAWLADLATVRAAGVDYPLALGDALSQLQLFEGVLIADLGAERYRALWSGTTPWVPAELEPVIAHYARLLEYADPALRARTPAQATAEVIAGNAAYVVRSDDALSTFRSAGMVYDREFTARPVPGTADVFSLQADAFTLPVGASHPDAARAWLRTVASAEAQKAISLTKASTPASLEVEPDDFTEYQRIAMSSLRIDTVVPSLSAGIAVGPSRTAAIMSAIERFGEDGRAEAFANALVAAEIGS